VSIQLPKVVSDFGGRFGFSVALKFLEGGFMDLEILIVEDKIEDAEVVAGRSSISGVS